MQRSACSQVVMPDRDAPGVRGARIVARARALVGTRFRLQGRSRTTGLDCIGAAAAAAGIDARLVRRDYPIRGTSAAELERELVALGLRPVSDGEVAAGDVAVFAPGPAQLHLGVFTGTSIVHADAGLGRVVERPMPPPWPLLGFWRLGAGSGGE